ncbi:hypothetical protein COOONC_06446 [Cooperia oncophora]
MVEDDPITDDKPKEKRLKKKKKVKKSSQVETSSVQESSTTSVTDDEIKYLRYSVSERYPAPRQLFLKFDKSNEFSLIVGNVPAYLPKGFVEGFLKQFVQVPITEVVEQRSNALDGSLNHGQLTLSVRFEDPKASALRSPNVKKRGHFEFAILSTLKYHQFCKVRATDSVALYRRLFPSAEEIQKSAMDFIQKQDEEMQEAKKAAKRKLTEPDEEGWITVTKAAKRVGKVMKLKKDEVPFMGGLKKKKNHVDIAFYSFDKKNTKVKKLNELREKFNQDKKRIALLKNARKFKPD